MGLTCWPPYFLQNLLLQLVAQSFVQGVPEVKGTFPHCIEIQCNSYQDFL